MKNLVFIGAGGFVKTLLDAIRPAEYNLIGFIDDTKEGIHLGLPIFGKNIEDVPDYKNCVYHVAIGKVVPREKWFRKIKHSAVEMATIIDPLAFVSPTAKIGEGNFIGKFAIVNRDAVIGDNNIINEKALISPSVRLGSHCNIAPAAIINGETIVGDRAFIGTSAVVNGQLQMGDDVTIGAGGVVVKDMGSDLTAVGVPAKIIKQGGERV